MAGEIVQAVSPSLLRKNLNFSNYSREEMQEMSRFLKKGTNFHADNPIIQGAYTSEQIKDISRTIQKNFSSNAINGREDAFPFVTCALMAKGYSIDDIVGNKVKKSDFSDIYTNIMNMNDPEKKAKAMEWAYDSFAKGMHKAMTEFDKRIDDSRLKSADTWMNKACHLLANTVYIGSSNYFEKNDNVNFREELMKASEKNELMYNNEAFDIDNVAKILAPKISKFNGPRTTQFLDAITTPEKETYQVIQSVTIFCNLANMMPKNVDGLSDASLNIEKNFENQDVNVWFDNLSDKPEANAFIYDCVKKGKFFNSIYIKGYDKDNDTYIYGIDANVDQLDEAYNEFTKDLETGITRMELEDANKADQNRNAVTQKEVEEVKKLGDNYTKASEHLDQLAATRLENMYSLIGSYSSNHNPTKTDYDRLKAITKVTDPIVKKAVNGERVSIRSLATDIPEDALVFGGEKGDTLNEIEMMEYKSMVHQLEELNVNRHLCDKKSNERTETAFSRDFKQFKQSYEGAEKASETKLIDAFVNKQKEAINELAQSETYKKIYNQPEVSSTNRMIKEKFAAFKKQLEDTSEKDKNGKLKGNTEFFTKMYEAVKKVAEYEGSNRAMHKGEGLDDLLQKAKENIDNYVKKRDNFIKFTKKGSDRVKIAKSMQKVSNIFTEEYGKFCEEQISTHNKNIKEAGCKDHDIKDILSNSSTKRTTKEKHTEKSMVNEYRK